MKCSTQVVYFIFPLLPIFIIFFTLGADIVDKGLILDFPGINVSSLERFS